MHKFKIALLSIAILAVFGSCENGDKKGTTDTNNTSGSKDVTDSTRKADSTLVTDSSRQH